MSLDQFVLGVALGVIVGRVVWALLDWLALGEWFAAFVDWLDDRRRGKP